MVLNLKIKMSKVLLINPQFNITKANYQTSINMGLLCLASYLKEHEIEVKLIDGARQDNYQDLIKFELSKGDVDLVGLSVMTMQIGSALAISRLIKDFDACLPVVWGGVQATLFPRQVAKHPLVDVAVLGEGEKTLLDLINAFRLKLDLSSIQGIAFRRAGAVVVNEKRDFLLAAELPLPNWSLMPEEILQKITLIPTHTSRGCPHQCAFCINPITKNRWRAYAPDRVLNDLEKIKQLPYFQNKPLRFWDEDFFVDISRAKEIIQGMIERHLDFQWETTVRADYLRAGWIDDEFLSLIKQSGCYLLSFGGESGSARVLKQINKGISPDQILFSARQTLKHGIVPQYSFMVGIPGENKKDIFKTVRLIDQLTKLSPYLQILGPQAFRPYPGSPLYQLCVASGWLDPNDLDGWAQVIKDELNYLSPRNFPWLQDVDLVESLEAYVRFGAHTIESALGSTVKSNQLAKLIFILVCKLRWKLKFFKWPVEFKLAKKMIVKT